MKVYNKLVRDKIPSIIEKNEGVVPKIRILETEEYIKELNIKLKEELNEYLESGEVEELADLENDFSDMIRKFAPVDSKRVLLDSKKYFKRMAKIREKLEECREMLK